VPEQATGHHLVLEGILREAGEGVLLQRRDEGAPRQGSRRDRRSGKTQRLGLGHRTILSPCRRCCKCPDRRRKASFAARPEGRRPKASQEGTRKAREGPESAPSRRYACVRGVAQVAPPRPFAAVVAKGSFGSRRAERFPPTLPVNLYNQKSHVRSGAMCAPSESRRRGFKSTGIAIGFLESAVC
jgi:hypothetical protein